MLAKLCLLGVGGDPLAFRVFLAMAAATGLLVVTDCSAFWASLLTLLKSFKPISSFFT